MRIRKTHSGVTLNAVAGTHVVLLGFDLTKARRRNCLGFAIQREDHTEDERYWLEGMKTFAETDPGLGPGAKFSSRSHPFQMFQWGDFSAKPDHDYTYTVCPVYGTPVDPQPGEGPTVRVQTEPENGNRHVAFFNRGAIASQEYVHRFQNRPPSEVGEAAYKWLSRGLKEALLDFIGRAKGPEYGLYGAIYEFQWDEVLNAVREAGRAGAEVGIVYDAKGPDQGPGAKNLAAVEAARIKSRCTGRTVGKIMHNKFFVLTRNSQPVAVWTGSTNLTENGLFGHSNCAHAIEDRAIAAQYLSYWHELHDDPENSDIKDWMERENPAPPDPWTKDETVVFSPHRGLKVLDWLAEVAGSARDGLMMTFPFGMHAKFQQVYEQPDDVLRFALMDKEGNGAGLKQGRIDIKRIRKLPNVIVAVGASITTNTFDRWLRERSRLNGTTHVRFVHTKYMLVDPLGSNPVVVTGSANFSAAGIDTNDENMLVIRGNTRVADIYLGEFMRLYSHYAFREAVNRAKEEGTLGEWQPNHLIPDDSWQTDYFACGSQRWRRRLYFAGRQRTQRPTQGVGTLLRDGS